MPSINFNVPWHVTGFHLIDALYAYQQSLHQDYQCQWEFRTRSVFDPSADFNVLGLYMPVDQDVQDIDRYDLILVNNSAEPLQVATDTLYRVLNTKSNCYFIANSYLSDSHSFYPKVIWWPNNLIALRDRWCRNFYPMMYNNLTNQTLTRDRNMIWINGRNDTWRHFVMQQITGVCSQIHVRNSLGSKPIKTNDSYFESDADRSWRDWVNGHYKKELIKKSTKSQQEHYYNTLWIGIDNKFGRIPLGYLILPEYFTHHCVIFPESAWQNDEVAITEKILKCCYSGSIPWPVGGRGINKLYGQLGFYTAWHLLPDHLQTFDDIEDHQERHREMIKSVQWLEQNPDVFTSAKFYEFTNANRLNFLTCKPEAEAVQKFSNLLESLLHQKGI